MCYITLRESNHVILYTQHAFSWQVCNFLGCQLPRKCALFLALQQNSQGKFPFSWRFIETAKQIRNLLGSYNISPRNNIFLAVYQHRQVKYSFLGGCILAAKETYGRQGNSSLWQWLITKTHIPWRGLKTEFWFQNPNTLVLQYKLPREQGWIQRGGRVVGAPPTP